jgi:aminoglycoside phosphotransferase (APT) family kinase protein
MADKPAAEIDISADLVRSLLQAQASDLADIALPLRHVADGWDCSVWRWGPDLAVRLPRRAVAAPLVLHEQQVLGDIAGRFAGTGVRVPAPILPGRPGSGYPWSWSVVPWFDGGVGLGIPRPTRSGWAGPLARALRALHVVAPAVYPLNPVRGGPLTGRADAVATRFAALDRHIEGEGLRIARRLWDAALEAPAWRFGPVWIHGDLHPGNLVADGERLVAVIDFGDVTAGDPAYDLAVAWLAFDSVGRASFRASLSDLYDAATWTRARGWAVAVTLMLLQHSDDNPAYAALGVEALRELTG